MATAEASPAFTMHQLAVFVQVAEAGTIAAAAARMHLSPSTLSAAVTELERALEAQLCVRRRAKGVALTPTGHAVLARARVLLHQAGELQADALGELGRVAGPVAVGCYPTLGPTLLPSLISGFTQRYPRATVQFREDTQNRLAAQVRDGEVDVAIVYDLDLPDQWRVEPLTQRAPMAHLAPEHPLADPDRPLDLAELAREPMVLLDAPPSSTHARHCCRQAGFSPRVAYRTSTYETARAFVGRGLGWSLLVQRPAHDMTHEGLPVAVKAIARPLLDPVTTVVAWRPEAPLSRAARAFVDYVCAEAAALGG